MLKLFSAIVIMFLCVNTASAGTLCFDSELVAKTLDKKFSEVPVAGGIATDGYAVKVFSSEGGKTWTILLTNPNGIACPVASGKSWITIEIKAGRGV